MIILSPVTFETSITANDFYQVATRSGPTKILNRTAFTIPTDRGAITHENCHLWKNIPVMDSPVFIPYGPESGYCLVRTRPSGIEVKGFPTMVFTREAAARLAVALLSL